MVLALVLTVIAGLLGLAAWIWLVVLAFRQGHTGWGIALIIGFFIPFGPLAALAYSWVHPDNARSPRHMLLGAMGLGIVAGFLMAGAARDAMDASPEFRQVEDLRQRAASDATSEGASTPPPAAEDTPKPPKEPQAVQSTVGRDESRAPRRNETAAGRQRPAPATSVVAAEPSTPRPAATPVSDPCPIRVDVVRLGPGTPNLLRQLDLRLANTSTQSVSEVKLGLDYIDARGRRIGGRSAVHSDERPLAGPVSTNEFGMMAFHVPEFTTSVRITVEAVVFGDRSRWPTGL